MPSPVDLLSAFLASGAVVVGGAVGVALLVRREGDRRAQVWLGALLLATAVTFVGTLLCEVGACTAYPQLYFLPLDYSLSVGPLVYLYVRERVAPGLSRRDAVHAVLPLAQAVLWTAVGAQSVAFKDWFWTAVLAPGLGAVLRVLVLASMGGYVAAALAQARGVRPTAVWEEARRRWLVRFLRVVGALVAVLALYLVADQVLGRVGGVNPYNWPGYALPKHLAYVGVLVAFAFHGWEQMHPTRWMPPPVVPPAVLPVAPPATAPRATTYGLNADALAAEAARVRAYVAAEEPFRNPDLTLGLLADALGMSDKVLSYVLNEGLGTPYATFVNGLRVEAARRALSDPAFDHLSVLGVGLDAGFSSKATFYRAFRSATGQTPAEARRAGPGDDLRPAVGVPNRR